MNVGKFLKKELKNPKLYKSSSTNPITCSLSSNGVCGAGSSLKNCVQVLNVMLNWLSFKTKLKGCVKDSQLVKAGVPSVEQMYRGHAASSWG